MLNEEQTKLFDDIAIVERFYNERVITLDQYHEIKLKMVDNYLDDLERRQKHETNKSTKNN